MRPFFVVRWIPGVNAACEPVAQSVEHLTFNQMVPGSTPGGLTTTSFEWSP